VEGETFVSGDYESATDFLNTVVQKEVLAQILLRTTTVPNGVSRMAMDSLSYPISHRMGGRDVVDDQRSGQMMGYLLSFPLLCLTNYITFTYCIPRNVPVKVNGDDIVFRATEQERKKWVEGVGKSGLVLSVGKTLVNKRFFTVNSALFTSGPHRVRLCPYIRAKSLFPAERDPMAILSLRGRFFSVGVGFSGGRLSDLRVAWLKENRSLIDATRRSLTRGLGLPVRYDQLVSAGLWAREAWHLSLPSEKPLPAPFSEWSVRPAGYEYRRVGFITKELRRAQEGINVAFVESAWERGVDGSLDGWHAEAMEGTYDCGSWFRQRSSGLSRRRRLLRISGSNARRFLSPDKNLWNPSLFKSVKRGVWVRTGSVPLRLVSGGWLGGSDLPRSAGYADLLPLKRHWDFADDNNEEFVRADGELTERMFAPPMGAIMQPDYVVHPHRSLIDARRVTARDLLKRGLRVPELFARTL